MTDHFRDLASPARLSPGDNLYSGTRAFRLSMQIDGNLVSYAIEDSSLPLDITKGTYFRPIFATQTTKMDVVRCELGADGNLVLYDSKGHPRWHSGNVKPPHPGAFLRCQDDGNLVIYAPTSGGAATVVWASNTQAGPR